MSRASLRSLSVRSLSLFSLLAAFGACSESAPDLDGGGGADGSGTDGDSGSGGAPLATGGAGSGTGGAASGGSATGATGGTPGSGGGPTGECEGIEGILSESEFNALFPNRNAAYTYQGMLDAVNGAGDLTGFPEFARTGDCDTRKRELAAFLANVSRETGLLIYIEQINKSGDYCAEQQPYGCPAGTNQYYGRGPIQLSWNYNYRAASLALFGDDRLLQAPSLVATTPSIAWATGFWFWMNGGGDYSPHDAIVTGGGFGDTIRIINGGEECDGGYQSYAEEAVSQRVCWYEKYVAEFDTTVGPGDLNCNTTLDREQYCD
ncbi:MAG TPA: chitinase [Polyangiaceae bacterium]|nr:chitinase [Polyangiaceae bacterium]